MKAFVVYIVFFYIHFALSKSDRSARIIVAPVDQRVGENEIASFVCKAHGRPAPRITWYHEGREVQRTGSQRHLVVPIEDGAGDDTEGAVLRVESATAGIDEGVYECRADNGVGGPASAQANLHVYPEGRVFPVRPVAYINLLPFMNDCDYKYRDKHEGVYECRADNGVGGPASAQANLHVYPEGRAPPGYPRIVVAPSVQSVEKSKSAVLRCEAEGEPEVKVSWVRDYVPLDMSNPRYSIIQSGTLQILEATSVDEGKYECVAENSVGVKYTFPVNLYVKDRLARPHFSIPPEDVEVVPGGNASLTCVAIGSPMPYVMWRLGPRELTPEGDVPIGKNVLELRNIQHSANYTCVASSTIGNIESTAEVRVKELPRSPVNVFPSEITSQSVRLYWSAGAERVDSFVIQYRVKSELWSEYHELTDIRSNNHVITGLDPFTIYELFVMASNSIGRSLPSDTVGVKTLESTPASPPKNIRARPVSQTSAIVQWEEPVKANGQIIGYTLYYTLNAESPLPLWSRVAVDNGQSASLGDLQSNKTYSIAMLASTAVGDGPVSEYVQVRTQKGVPEQPENLKAEAVSDKVIRLTWDPPLSSGEIVDSYEIYYGDKGRTSHVSVTAPKDSHVIGDLQPNTEYSIQISARSSVGEGARTNAVLAKTFEAAPSGAPLDVAAEPIDSTSLKVTWSVPALDLHNGVIAGYRVYRALAAVGEDRRDEVAVAVHAKQLQFVLKDLRKWTQYRVWVRAFTRSGDGPPSVNIIARTDEDTPGEPKRVRLRAHNSTAIIVQWRPPAEDDRNGVIRGYYIYYAASDEAHDSGKFMVKEIRGDIHTEAVLDGLRPNTQYQIQVAAYTRKGDGNRSRIRKVNTKATREVSLGPPRNLNLRMSSINPPTVTVTWEAPRGVESGAVSYKVEWSSHSSVKESHFRETTYLSLNASNLDYGTEYEFRVSAKSSDGSAEEAVENIVTSEGIPMAAPDNITTDVVSATSVRMSWTPLPIVWSRGVVTMYEIRYSLSTDVIGRSSISSSVTWKVIDGLAANQHYLLQLRACTAVGCGPWGKSVEIKTLGSSNSDAPAEVKVNRECPESVTVMWAPSSASGLIGYRVYGSTTANSDIGSWNKYVDVSASMDVAHLTDLVPSIQYYVMVRAKIDDSTFGSWSEIVVAPAQVTSEFYAIKDLKTVTISPSSVTLHWTPPDRTGVLFYKMEFQGEYKRKRRGALPIRGERTVSNSYTSASFHDLQSNVSYTFSITPKFDGNYWGPTRTVYHPSAAQFQANTPLSHGQSAILNPADQANVQLLIILVPVCVGIVAILLIVLILVYIRRKKAEKQMNRSQVKTLLSYPVEIPPPYTDTADQVEMCRINYTTTPAMQMHPPIPVDEFSDHVTALRANEHERFSRDYESIEPGQTFTWDASNLECNCEKNRYANVIAYDHSRVILQNGLGSDYINANYMNSYSRENAYIATQGPLETSIADFWQMVWEQDSPTIVMMTKLEERKRIKCDRYWPNYGTETYGNINVTLIDVVELSTHTMRVFNISEIHTSEKRTVHQFQFTAWPDHGVPEHPTPLLQFMRRVRALTPPDAGPVVVHCSAGVGRTGAYIVIDAMLERIALERTVDIYCFVTHLRAQRNYMVQTEDQYVFIHEAVLEAITAGDSEVHAERLYIHIQQLTQYDHQHGCTKMEVEFKRLNDRKVDPSRFLSANLPCNRDKNRNQGVLPYEGSRVCLQMIRGVEGSDYINASYIDGYQYKRAYIATQSPLESTAEDFWRMLWENNCTVVVMLTKIQELGTEKCYQYWPEERPATYKYFAVEPQQLYTSPMHICREFKVTDVRSGQSRTLRQFHFTDWPDQGVPNSGDGFIEFIGQVQKVRDQSGQDGPIVVHCGLGVGRTGVFIALSIVLERMKCEGVIDMYQTVNMLRTQRPDMVQNEDQYAFCHRAALEYLSSFDHYGSTYSTME